MAGKPGGGGKKNMRRMEEMMMMRGGMGGRMGGRMRGFEGMGGMHDDYGDSDEDEVPEQLQDNSQAIADLRKKLDDKKK